MLLLFVILYFNPVRRGKPFPPTYIATNPFFTVNFGVKTQKVLSDDFPHKKVQVVGEVCEILTRQLFWSTHVHCLGCERF